MKVYGVLKVTIIWNGDSVTRSHFNNLRLLKNVYFCKYQNNMMVIPILLCWGPCVVLLFLFCTCRTWLGVMFINGLTSLTLAVEYALYKSCQSRSVVQSKLMLQTECSGMKNELLYYVSMLLGGWFQWLLAFIWTLQLDFMGTSLFIIEVVETRKCRRGKGSSTLSSL